MFGINKNGTKHKVGIIMPAFFPASRTTYDNTTSGLSATRVQGAIDAVEGQIANSSDAYSASKAYSVGDYCIYNDTLYRCITACSAASWAVNSGCFVADTVVGVMAKTSQRTVTKINNFTGTATMTDYALGVGFADVHVWTPTSISANTQINFAQDAATDNVTGSFVAKITDSGGVVKGYAGIFIIAIGGYRYMQAIPNATIPAGGALWGAGLYRYE